jgi:LPXTG-site transpeptidase (sortase) family protein
MAKQSARFNYFLRITFVIGLLFIASSLITIGTQQPPIITSPSFEQRLLPVKIQLPSGKQVNLVRTQLSDGTWFVDQENGNYLSDSAELGSNGNVVIYGHNFDHIFGTLDSVKPGEVVRLTDQNQQEHAYRIEHITEVEPSDTSWIQPTQDPMLTLYTCSGLFDSKRLIVRAAAI